VYVYDIEEDYTLSYGVRYPAIVTNVTVLKDVPHNGSHDQQGRSLEPWCSS
jgi:hypothetical protein